ncbi:hypothetical protein [Streptomyces sp. NPDC058847]|uniref:hypothetical protein n=1 Tax=Streptomyces sp. NPDC058847 TaxID=3346649 RepID=UPI003679F5C5
MSAPLVVNTRDGACWTRRTVTEGGVALYALADVCSCPEFVMATLPELAERGIVGSADALPMPAGTAPRTEVERLAKQVLELQHELREARFDAACARRERDVIRERVSEPYGCAHCGVVQRVHGRRYMTGAGMHGWERPSEEQVKDRMLARRAARVPVGPEPETFREEGVYRNGTAARVQLARYAERTKTWSTATYDSGTERALHGMAVALAAEADALRVRVAELEAAPRTVYRASYDSIPMGLYTTAAEARRHCETELRREWPNSLLDWVEDEEDDVAELVAENADGQTETGYVVTALEVAAAYDEEADE